MKRLLVAAAMVASAAMVGSLLSPAAPSSNSFPARAPQAAKSNPQGPPGATPSSYDARAFSAELQRISLALATKSSPSDLAELKKSIPPNWDVRSGGRSYAVSSEPLRTYLASGAVQKADEWVRNLRRETAPRPDYAAMNAPPTARPELNRILASPEFGAVRPPSAFDLLKQRIAAWIQRMLLKLFSRISGHPLGVKIFFWTLLICAVAFVGFMILRLFQRGNPFQELNPASAVISAWSWQQWVRNARQSAERGDFREAIHSLYWAGISRLEDVEALPRDRSKTPREYLRLAKETRATNERMEEKFLDPLARLTTRLERIWYADDTATAAEFAESMAQVEALGCQPE